MTNAEIILRLEASLADPIFKFTPDLTKAMQLAAWKLRDYQTCEDELRRITGVETMRGVVDKLNRGGDGQEAAY